MGSVFHRVAADVFRSSPHPLSPPAFIRDEKERRRAQDQTILDENINKRATRVTSIQLKKVSNNFKGKHKTSWPFQSVFAVQVSFF